MALGSFLRRLAGPAAGIAASFIPGAGGALGPLIGGAVGSLVNRGGGGGGDAAGGPSPYDLPELDPAEAARRRDISGGLQGLQTTTTGATGRLLGGAEEDIGGARGFYSRLASGDPAAAAAALAPSLGTARRQYQGAIESIEQFSPRGGGRSAALNRARIGRAGTLAGITAQAQPMGAEGLTRLAGVGGELGLGAGQLATGAGRTAADISLGGEQLAQERGATAGRLQAERDRIALARRGQNIDLATGIGSGVADFLGATGLGGKIGRGLSRIFGGGGGGMTTRPERYIPPAGAEPQAPAPIALPTNITPPEINVGPVTQQYATGLRASNRRLAAA